ncbi:hypothetical protein OU800_18635 [Pseudomonas sp. GOM7]|nr:MULTISPECIES: hypothetical protein [unclassified Pseudomonas]WAJ36606.1 hypothetical protein OU800_18635 [Pseudomonas sp. GOM7]
MTLMLEPVLFGLMALADALPQRLVQLAAAFHLHLFYGGSR